MHNLVSSCYGVGTCLRQQQRACMLGSVLHLGTNDVPTCVLLSGECQMRILQESGPPVFDRDELLAEQAKSSSSGSGLVRHNNSTCQTPDNSSNTGATGSSAPAVAAADVGIASTADSSPAAAAACPGVVVKQEPLQQHELQQHPSTGNDTNPAQAVKCMSSDDILATWKQYLKDLTLELMNLQAEAAAAVLQTSRAAAAGGAGALEEAFQLPAGAVGGPPAQVNLSSNSAREFAGSSGAAQRLNALVKKYSSILIMASSLNPGRLLPLIGPAGNCQPLSAHIEQDVVRNISTTR